MESSTDPEDVFQIEEKIGEGSYGSVLHARHRGSKKDVAIKIIPVESDLKDLMKEINILKSCKCNNIVRYYGSYVKDRDLWIVMEYCAAGSMSDLMAKGRFSLKEEEIRLVISQVLLGIAYLHENKKIHRDIKAGNILLTESGVAKLADFGVSIQLDSTLSKRKTVIGTPYWMAPEVIKEEEYNFLADIWSLGITAIELAEGVPPFSNIHPMRAIFMIPNRPPPRLQNEGRWSKEFVDFISKCLVKEPAHRPSAQQLLQHPFVKDTVSQIKDGTAHMSIVTDMIARLRELKTKLKKSEKGNHSVSPNAPAVRFQPPNNRPGAPKPSAPTNDSSAGTIVIKSEAGKPSSAAKPLSHPPNPRNNPPSHRNVQPLLPATRKPQSVANHNTPSNIPLVSKPSNGPTTASTSSSNIPSSSSKPVKNGLPILRQPNQPNQPNQRPQTVIDFCTSALIPELPTKKPSSTGNLSQWIQMQRRGMQATEQFKEDLRLLAGSYIAEMEMIINSMNGLVYTCFAKTNNILFIFRTDLEKMNNHIEIILLLFLWIDFFQ